MNKTPTPTTQTYEALQMAYDFFNAELFDGELKSCLLTLQRRDKRCFGYFSPNRFIELKGKKYTDEIAMNPLKFTTETLKETMQTLVHEQVHLWQFHFGKDKSRKGYHNKEWGAKMKAVGLYPSSTGKPGGKETGQKMADYAIEGGVFEKAFAKLVKQKFFLRWGENDALFGGNADEEEDGESESKSNRQKFTCPKCRDNAWGKPSLSLICGTCKVKFVPVNKGEADDLA